MAERSQSHHWVLEPLIVNISQFDGIGNDPDPLPCRTNDGLPISVSFSFNFRLVQTVCLSVLYLKRPMFRLNNYDRR
jgi:hypothetical protein